MNLIDKDILIVELQKMQEKGSKETRSWEGDGGYCLGLEDAIMAAENAVIVEERKHGHYIHKGAWHLECSECSNILAHISEEKNFCPNCGAIMDEDEVITC